MLLGVQKDQTFSMKNPAASYSALSFHVGIRSRELIGRQRLEVNACEKANMSKVYCLCGQRQKISFSMLARKVSFLFP